MEREILLSGIGGQGVQLASKSLATAAIKEGRNALMFGSYGGTMRGGDTDATVVIATDRLMTPPVIDHAWSAVVMHPMSWPLVHAKLRPGGLVLINTGVFKEPVSYDGTILELDAASMSTAAGMPQAGSMVALGAFIAATGIVSLDAVFAISEEVLPPYRRKFAEANRTALKMGFDAVPKPLAAAWDRQEQFA